jgi:hypothetical protein
MAVMIILALAFFALSLSGWAYLLAEVHHNR